MLDRLAWITRVRDHVNPGNPVVIEVAAHPLTPRRLVLRVARSWFTADPGPAVVIVKREISGRPPTTWEITFFPPAPSALDQPADEHTPEETDHA